MPSLHHLSYVHMMYIVFLQSLTTFTMSVIIVLSLLPISTAPSKQQVSTLQFVPMDMWEDLSALHIEMKQYYEVKIQRYRKLICYFTS